MNDVPVFARRQGDSAEQIALCLSCEAEEWEAARKAPTWKTVTAVELTARRLGVGLVAAWYMRLRGEG